MEQLFLSAYILNKILKISAKTYFVVEMPSYKLPLFKNVAINVVEKTKAFVVGAGKIILAISVILWFLASYGPGKDFNEAETIVKERFVDKPLDETEFENEVASQKLENSYIGIMGKAIEPAISPLGYDWKIGIAIISSFAAREVFVGTLATIYSVGSSDNEATIKSKMQEEINPANGSENLQFCFRNFIVIVLCFCDAMCQYIGHYQKRNQFLEMACHAAFLNERICLFCSAFAYQLLK